MKKSSLVVAIILVLSLLPAIYAVDVGTGIGVTMETEDFPPLVWMCNRTIADDNVEQGENGPSLVERHNNYAFEGESVSWLVLVMDKNGVEKISDVYATIGATQGAGNDIEVNCDETSISEILESCNARIGEEELTEFDPNTMRYYTCTLTVESPDSMYGEYYVTVEAEDLDGLTGTFDENEYWFFNPVLALSITGNLDFGIVRPGTTSYSDTILVGNDADEGSGVTLDMYISGTDFYDPTSSGAKCPTTNQLALTNFRYYAVNGAYTTASAPGADTEGYLGIPYGDRITQAQRIIDGAPYGAGAAHHTGNTLSPGSEMAITFKLNLPEPCNGDFSDGNIYFWGEAV